VFLFVKMDASLVDVNVHPTKIEVRFRNANEVFQEVRDAIHAGLKGLASPVTPRATPLEAPAGRTEPAGAPPPRFTGLGAAPKPREESIRRAMADFFAGSQKRQDKATEEMPQRGGAQPADAPPIRPAELHPPAPSHRAFQLHNAYIVVEAEEGVEVIDQHALHERILRETLESRMKESRILSQRLLVPVTVHLTPKEFNTLMELRDGLAKIGVDFTDFGQNTIAIHAMPQLLDRCEPTQFVRDILDGLGSGRDAPSLDQRLEAILNLAACKGAVKAGQPLSPEQIRNLLEERARLRNPSVCAHGRPASVLLTFEYLQKQFART
jgi:DNA mismatch repair protein MutL